MQSTIIILILGALLIVGGGLALFIIHQLDKQKVKIIVATPDRRLKTFKVKPNGKTVTVDGKTFNINDDDLMLIKGMPTYVFNSDNTQPINLFEGIQSLYNPEQYNSAIENRLIDEIFKSSSKKGSFNESPLTMILLLGILGGIGIIGFFGYDFIETVMTKLDAILEAMRNIGLQV